MPKFLTRINNDLIYEFTTKEVVKLYKIWNKNRPIDNERVNEICLSIQKNKQIDGMVYFGHIPNQNWVCYDGNNRIHALKKCKVDIKIIVVKTKYKTEDEMISRYLELNKAMPIPEIYTVPEDLEIYKKKVEEIVNYICLNYSNFKSTSKRPNRPNFNVTDLTNIITDYIKKYPDKTLDQIKSDIKYTNKYYKDKYNESKEIIDISERIVSKCKKYNCFLFLKPLKIKEQPIVNNLIELN